MKIILRPYQQAFIDHLLAMPAHSPWDSTPWKLLQYQKPPIKDSNKMNRLQVKIKRTDPAARMPQRATNGSLCYDLYAVDDGRPHPADDHATHYRTGLAFECSPGWGFKIHSRSGHGFKSALRLSNSTGLIDCDYRGEVMVSIRFDASGTHRAQKLRAGDCIAQIEFIRQVEAEFIVVDELGDSVRGAGGFGSTDVCPQTNYLIDEYCRNAIVNSVALGFRNAPPIPKSCPRCGHSKQCPVGIRGATDQAA